MSKMRISERSTTHSTDFIRVATLDELKTAGMIVVRGARCPLLVVYDDGKVFALDNRCPHLGFPLHRGTVEDGILTCHWHHARFDLASGCTFDLWADDVPTAAVEVRDGVVLAKATRRNSFHLGNKSRADVLGWIQVKSPCSSTGAFLYESSANSRERAIPGLFRVRKKNFKSSRTSYFERCFFVRGGTSSSRHATRYRQAK